MVSFNLKKRNLFQILEKTTGKHVIKIKLFNKIFEKTF